MHGLILSGIAMSIAGSSRPCSGAEHKISHAIDMLYPGTSQHGLQVALGTLLAGFMRKEPLEKLLTFARRLNLPTSYRDLGLSEEQFVQCLLNAPRTRERYTVLEAMKLDASSALSLIRNYEHAITTY